MKLKPMIPRKDITLSEKDAKLLGPQNHALGINRLGLRPPSSIPVISVSAVLLKKEIWILTNMKKWINIVISVMVLSAKRIILFSYGYLTIHKIHKKL